MKANAWTAMMLVAAIGCSGGKGDPGTGGSGGVKGDTGPSGAAGPTGPQGPTGPAGDPGAQGTSGAQGAIGLTGAAGAKGDTGATGPVGSIGATGAPGASVSGSSLAVGDQHCPQGGVSYTVLGVTSYVCTGAPGRGVAVVALAAGDATCAQGGTRIDGASGSTYVCNGLIGGTGAAGVSVTATALSIGDANCVYGGTQFVSSSGASYACDGAVGAQGPKGDTGAAGPAGTLVSVTCAQGQVLQGINASGSAICVGGGDAAPATLVQRIANAANRVTSGFGNTEWETIPGFALPFVSAGGPVVVTPSLSMIGSPGNYGTCRPLIDGIPAGVFVGEDTTNIWGEGLMRTDSGWQLWSATRGYTSVPPGRHLVTLQCKSDVSTVIGGDNTNDTTTEILSLIPYGDPATAEVKAYTVNSANPPSGQNIGCCSFSSIVGLTTQFTYQGGPVRISLAIPLQGAGANAACRPLIDGAPAAAEAVDSWGANYWDEGLLSLNNNGWDMWNRTRIYSPSAWATPLTVGTHTASVECRADTGTLRVGTGASAANLTVITYRPSKDATATVHPSVALATISTLISTTAWTALPGLSTTFISNGGPVEVGLSLPINSTTSGATGTCRPLVDGNPISGDAASEPDDWSSLFNEGLLTVYSGWHMWNRVRMYRGIAAGTHTLTAQCRIDNPNLNITNAVTTLWAIAYDQ